MRACVADEASPHHFAAATTFFRLEMTRTQHGRAVSGTGRRLSRP